MGPIGDRPRASRSWNSALAAAAIGPYQLQAAIAAVHAEAPSADQTDWHQIVVLYTLLERIAPNPVFALNRAVAVAMAQRSRGWPRRAQCDRG